MAASESVIAGASYLSIVIVMSCVSFVLYGFDKRRATTAGRRVSEQTFYLAAFLGGWPGSLLGQRYFRHKTKKFSFLIRFWLVVLLHVTMVGVSIYLLSHIFSDRFKLSDRGESRARDLAVPMVVMQGFEHRL